MDLINKIVGVFTLFWRLDIDRLGFPGAGGLVPVYFFLPLQLFKNLHVTSVPSFPPTSRAYASTFWPMNVLALQDDVKVVDRPIHHLERYSMLIIIPHL